MKPEELLALTAAPIYAELMAGVTETIRDRYDDHYRAQAIRKARNLIADSQRLAEELNGRIGLA